MNSPSEKYTFDGGRISVARDPLDHQMLIMSSTENDEAERFEGVHNHLELRDLLLVKLGEFRKRIPVHWLRKRPRAESSLSTADDAL
jgi:hypothetical protein